jgi:membrane fusion protein, multidrug efflux system
MDAYFGALTADARSDDAWTFKRRKMKNYLMLSVTILLLSACEKPAEQPPPARPALVMEVGKTATNSAIILVGEVKSRYESNQGFRISGKIIERKVDVGSVVKKGQIIARLDAADTNLSAASAQADVRAAEASRALAKSEVERQRMLVEKKFISQSALDKYEAELKTADARVNQAKAQAAVSGNQSRYTGLVADRDGVVTQIRAEPGQVVEAGEMIAQIVDIKQIEVLVAVPESRMAQLKVGDVAAIKLWAAREKTYVGKVREIAPAANSATRAFDVRVAMNDADAAVKLGMTAGVRFEGDALPNIIIPSSALTQKNGKNSVWVIDKNGIANPREVATGQFTEEGVIVSSGLQHGELIAIAGVHTLIKGQKVVPKIEKLL